jgi:polyhydroxyalkanoate synthase subunit PhaC
MSHPPGSLERGHSSWLGQHADTSDVFQKYRDIDRWLLSSLSQLTGGLAPATLAAAGMDWWVHLLASPAKQMELLQLVADASSQLAGWSCGGCATPSGPFEPLPQDKRFAAPGWEQWPFRLWAQSLLLAQHAWQHATSGVPGVSRHHEAMVDFAARQWLDMASPSNGVLSNPLVLERTLAEGGANLLRGALHATEDALRESLNLPPAGAENFVVGRNVAVTPGQVILRTRLAELIQYEPTTPRTQREPVLLVPAWIMKYYILDLSPHNSLVKALLDQGFTVFALSWKNPTPEDRDTTLADYFHLGVEAALDTIAQVMPDTPVHALGYCLGGTLLAMSAAALARSRPQALQSITLLAAQTDFADPGELGLFIDAAQVEMLDDTMWRQGVLQARQMRGAFQMLRSQDLIWSYRVVNHLLGERPPFTDLMAWNADGTRLPYRMHSEYLHTLFLDNALARGQARLDGRALNLADIHTPIFSVGAVQDHVAPWRSVFKLQALTDTEQTFVLTAGGHNVGIVNPPGQARTSHRIGHWKAGDRLLTPDEWLAATPSVEGSWWTAWFEWLREHSSGERKPPAIGAARKGLHPLGAAPGQYVLDR